MAETSATLRAYIEQLLQSYDSTLDLSAGSPIQEQVIEPLLSRLGADPIDTDIGTFILDRMDQDHPDIDIRGAGSTAGALLADVPSLLLLALKREIQHVKTAQSLENIDEMADEEVDALLANQFEERVTGRRAEVDVRVYFALPTSITVDFTNLAGTATGLKFLPKEVVRVSNLDMQSQVEDDLYYADVRYIAEAPGAAYNVAPGDIAFIENLPNVVRVANKRAPDVLGIDWETSTEFKVRAEELLAERSPVGARAIRRTLLNDFSADFQDIQVVGHGDVEMERDVLRADIDLAANQTVLGPVKAAGTLTVQDLAVTLNPCVDGWRPTYKLNLTDKPANVVAGDVIVTGRTASPGNIRARLILSYSSTTGDAVVADFSIPAAGKYSGGIPGSGGFTTEYYPIVGGVQLDSETGAPVVRTPILKCNTFTTGGFDSALPGDWIIGMNSMSPIHNAPPDVRKVVQSSASQVTFADPYVVTVYGADGSTAEGGPTNSLNTTHTFTSREAVPGKHLVAVMDAESGDTWLGPLNVPPFTGTTLHLAIALSGGLSNLRFTVVESPSALHYLDAGKTQLSFFLLHPAAAGVYDGMTEGGILEEGGGTLVYTAHAALTAADINAVLSVDSMPGGILNPSTPQGTLEVASDEVHVGGCFDAYVQPKRGATARASVDLLLVDGAPLVQAGDLVKTANSTTVLAASLTTAAVAAEMVLVLYGPNAGADAGTYRVLRVEGTRLYLDAMITVTAINVSYYVVSDVHIRLDAPKRLKLSGTSLKTNMDSDVVEVSEDLASADVLAGDKLEIKGIGQNAGVYVIESVGVDTVRVSPAPPMAEGDLSYEIYTAYTNIDRPMVRPTHWEVLDDAGQSTGVVIPPRDPVDVRALAFENEGFNIKVPTAGYDGREGIIVTGPGLPAGVFLLGDRNVSFAELGIGAGDWVFLTDDNPVPNRGWFEVKASLWYQGLELLKGAVDVQPQGSLVDWPETYTPPAEGYQVGVKYRVGSRSVGRVRMYFLAPTYVDAGPVALFTDPDAREFIVSPLAESTLVERTSETADLTASEPPNGYVTSATEDFRKDGVVVGDFLTITAQPIRGKAIAATMSASGLALNFQFREYSTVSLVLAGTDPLSLTAGGVPGGVVEQINRASKGLLRASVESAGGELLKLRLDSPHPLRVGEGTANAHLFAFGSGETSGWNDEFAQQGTYRIGDITDDGLGATKLFLQRYFGEDGTWLDTSLAAGTDFKFLITRRGHQIVGPATMEPQIEDGLYYADVELVSKYLGDQYNLAKDTRLTVTGLASLGYRLTTEKPELTFSAYEEVLAVVSPLVLNAIDGDRIAAAHNVVELDSRLDYDRCNAAGLAQVLMESDETRTVCANPLVRTIQPGYMYFTASYGGGSSLVVIQKDLLEWLKTVGLVIQPYDVISRISRRGATSVVGPIVIAVVVHTVDRGIRVYRFTTRGTLPRTVRVTPLLDNISVSKVG